MAMYSSRSSGTPHLTGPKSTWDLIQSVVIFNPRRWSGKSKKYHILRRLPYARKLRNKTELEPSRIHAESGESRKYVRKITAFWSFNDSVYPFSKTLQNQKRLTGAYPMMPLDTKKKKRTIISASFGGLNDHDPPIFPAPIHFCRKMPF